MSTNIFETQTGLLNLAPIKISGQYKIVIDKNNNFYLDDYNDKRVLINKNQRFLPQLTNFLRTKSEIQDYNKLRYGGFSNKKTLSYHLPIYINQKNYPNYFVINNLGYGSEYDTNNITNDTNLGNISRNLNIVDLKQIGIHNIFEELYNLNSFEFPFYSNFEDHKITLYGYDFTNNNLINKQFSLLNFSANQTYFGSLNNHILNLYKDNDIIFPRFINLEFEFEDTFTDNKLFGNYYGYLTEGEIITDKTKYDNLKTQNKYGIFANDFIINDNLYQRQNWEFNISKYKLNVLTVNSYDVINTIPFARLKFNFIDVNDEITIWNDDSVYYKYVVTQENIKTSFRETLVSIANSINFVSDFQINVSLDNSLQNILNFEINSDLPNMKFKKSDKLNQYIFIDKFNVVNKELHFYQITDNDIIINNVFDNQETKIGEYLKFSGHNNYIKIKDYFIYQGNVLCRLEPNDLVLSLRNKNLVVQIFVEKNTENYYLKPLNFYSFINNTIIESNYQYDKNSYLLELEDKFTSPAFLTALKSFKEYSVIDTLQFVDDKLDSKGYVLNTYPDINTKQVLNIKFNSAGNTAYITPNFFNFDKNFYNNNGNLLLQKVDLDDIKFHWFLIQSEVPEYLKDEKYFNAQLRYFTDTPKITSRLIDTGTNCETIFLGVKYNLPRKYKNYQFAVYLDYNDTNFETDDVVDTDEYDGNKYSFIINNQKSTIFLKINRYLDFIDLLRDGNSNKQPFIDLSFFYSVRQAYNTESDLIMTFKSGGLIMCDDVRPTIFNNEVITDWKIQVDKPGGGKKWLICLKRSNLVNTSSLRDLISNVGEALFFVYSKINNTKYRSMIYKLKNIEYVSDDYVWCEDVIVQFFDNENLIINDFEGNQNIEEDKLYQLTTNEEFNALNPNSILINDTDIVALLSQNNLINQNANVTLLTGDGNKTFKIINTLVEYSLKKHYIETKQKVRYLNGGEKSVTTETFKFPECELNLTVWNEMISNDFDSITRDEKITIFDRNQLWFLIKNVMSTELKFKHNTESQTIKIINELLLNNLYEYSNLNSIAIENNSVTKEYVKLNVVENDDNVVIWGIENTHKLVKVNRYSGPYFPHFDIIKKLSEFQVINSESNQIVNIFDKRYGNVKDKHYSSSFKNIKNIVGQNIETKEIKLIDNVFADNNSNADINAIGLIDEVDGNIVSSLMIKTNDIISTVINSSKNKYSFIELLKNTKNNTQEIFVTENLQELLSLNNIYPDKNKEYISIYNKNINEYIYINGVSWLMNNFYYLDNIVDSDNKKIRFNIIDEDIIIENYQPNGKYIFNFKRK